MYDSGVTYVSWIEIIQETLIVGIGEINDNRLHTTLKFSIKEEEINSISMLSR